MIRAGQLVHWLVNARTRTFELYQAWTEHDASRLAAGRLDPRWTVGHLAWLAHDLLLPPSGKAPLEPSFAALFDPVRVPAENRTEVELPNEDRILSYAAEVQARALHAIMGPGEVSEKLARDALFLIDYEDRLGEELLVGLQHLGAAAPELSFEEEEPPPLVHGGRLAGDVEIPAVRALVGAGDDRPALAVERPVHAVEVEAFRMSRAPVTEEEFAAFVIDGGYSKREWWSESGWAEHQRSGRKLPIHWRGDKSFELSRFGQWRPLDPRMAMCFVSYFEAEAYAAWSGRRLPSEAEWELAASLPLGDGLSRARQVYPWGNEVFSRERANTDGRFVDTVSVDLFPAGDSPWGLRQLLGNTWEWTQSVAAPYAGYAENASPSWAERDFGSARVLRGGSFASRSRFLSNTTRRFAQPANCRVAAGFRTCAV